jgi:hypothetical protein
MHDDVAAPRLPDEDRAFDSDLVENVHEVVAHRVEVVPMIRFVTQTVSTKIDGQTRVTTIGEM